MAHKRLWFAVIFTSFLIGIVSAGTPPITIGASYLKFDEIDPFWTGNLSNVAFTNIDEVFDLTLSVLGDNITIGGIKVATLNDLITGNVTVTSIVAVKNTAGATANKGAVMRFTDYNSGVDRYDVVFADNTNVSLHADCLMLSSTANNLNGQCVVAGIIENVDTSGWAESVMLFVNDTAGTLTETRPSTAICVQMMAQVMRSHATLGTLRVHGAGRCVDVPNNFSISGNITASYFFGNGSQLTGIMATESDPFWTGNQSLVYLKSNPFGFYNSSDFSITDYYLKNNPFGFFNSSDFSISDYYLKNNPFGFYNSTNPQTENDPYWTGNVSNVAFTNIDETFDENLDILGNLTIGSGTTYFDLYYNGSTNLFDTKGYNAYFEDNITADYFIGNGSQLTGLTLIESDPLAYNGTLAYLSDILGWDYYNSTDFSISDYFTKSDILGFSYYNSTDFSISDYFTKSDILGFSYYNSTDFSIGDYSTTSTILGWDYYNSTIFDYTDYRLVTNISFVGNVSSTIDLCIDGGACLSAIGEGITWVEATNGTLYLSSNPFGFYNSSDFSISDYYLKNNPFGFWNDTYATFNKTYADTLYVTSESDPIFTAWDNFTGIPHTTPSDGDTTHFSLADEIYDWVIGLAYATQSWVNTQLSSYVAIADLVGLVGNWSDDKSSYWNTSTDLDGVIDTDEITELKIDFNTECSAGNHLYVSGNNLACEADDYNSAFDTEDEIEAVIFDSDNTANLGLGNYNVTNISYSTFCNGANCWKMYVNASDYFIIEEI